MRKIFIIICATLLLPGQVVHPGEKGVAMGHLHILSPDPEKHRRLWMDGIGATPLKIGPLDCVMLPGVVIAFRQGPASGGSEGSVVNHVGFLVKRLPEMQRKLADAGVQVIPGTSNRKRLVAIFPDGVKVEFTEDASLDVPIRFDHVHFATPDAREMRAWYAKTFGPSVPGVNFLWESSGKATLPTKGTALDHIGLEVRDIKSFCRNLERAGLKLDTQPVFLPDLNVTIAFITDPWGTRIELTEGLNRYRSGTGPPGSGYTATSGTLRGHPEPALCG